MEHHSHLDLIAANDPLDFHADPIAIKTELFDGDEDTMSADASMPEASTSKRHASPSKSNEAKKRKMSRPKVGH